MRNGRTGEGQGLGVILRLRDTEEHIRKRLPIKRFDTRDGSVLGISEGMRMQPNKLTTHK